MRTDTVVVLPVGRGGGGGVKAAAFAPNDRDNLGSNPLVYTASEFPIILKLNVPPH